MLISTAILKISDSKNLGDNHSSLALLKRIQENKQIVYENKIVDADKKKITETLLQWVENKDLDIIISALSLGGDTRLYFILKNVRDNNKLNDVWDEVECDI